MEQPAYHWTDFHKILYLNVFRKHAENTKLSLKSEKNNGTLREELCTLHEELCTLIIKSRSIPLRPGHVLDKICRKIKTLCMNNKFFSKNPSVYEIMWKNMAQPGRL
jgi:hypothetical protein